MKKATRVIYDPFKNSVSFEISQSTGGPWDGLSEGSSLLKYSNQSVLFSNCVVDIVSIINDSHNSVKDGLEIQFIGPDSDYDLLESTAKRIDDERCGAGPLTCSHVGFFANADEVLDVIRDDYARISSEFDSYLPGSEYYACESKRIGDVIVKFEETISDAIPVCVIGNYSVGKSALINSLIGEDVLPSKVDPSTAKNVKVIRGEEYRITLFRDDGDGETRPYKFMVATFGLKPLEESPDLIETASRLNAAAGVHSGGEVAVLRDLLNALNEGCRHPKEAELLSSFGCNVIIEMPFKKSLLDRAENRIAFFDTPGSDNIDIDQEEHSQALEKLLGEQTNALPILVTERDRTSGRGTGEVMHKLDEYSENFSSPSCVVVLTKCDKLSLSELKESVSSEIKNWHGKSIILYTTPIGALGLRKGEDSPWLDESYKDIFEDWQVKQGGQKRVSLPEHNSYPCGRRGSITELGVDEELFDTGIPSLEYEILYYIENHSKYKKCVRGRKDLLDALSAVKAELDEKRDSASKAKEEAVRRKDLKRTALLDELDSLHLATTAGLDVKLARRFSTRLDEYCGSLTEVMGSFYDSLDPDRPLEMDEALNEMARRHCQKNLIDKVYLAEDGARNAILEVMGEYAEKFATDLQEYVSKNESHFTDYGKDELSKYLQSDLRPPKFKQVNSVLDSIGELIEKASLVQHGIRRIVNNEEAAKAGWVESKSKSFEDKLRGGKGLFGREIPGLFLSTVFTKPVSEYSKQLKAWSDSYRTYVKERLDEDNMLLSDMEAEIEGLEARVSDLEQRLGQVADVETELISVLDSRETRF